LIATKLNVYSFVESQIYHHLTRHRQSTFFQLLVHAHPNNLAIAGNKNNSIRQVANMDNVENKVLQEIVKKSFLAFPARQG
jgi:hypothetical protein